MHYQPMVLLYLFLLLLFHPNQLIFACGLWFNTITLSCVLFYQTAFFFNEWHIERDTFFFRYLIDNKEKQCQVKKCRQEKNWETKTQGNERPHAKLSWPLQLVWYIEAACVNKDTLHSNLCFVEPKWGIMYSCTYHWPHLNSAL